jgi:hypothetical protein
MGDLLNAENIKTAIGVASALMALILGPKIRGIIELWEWHRTKQEEYVKKMLSNPELDAPTKEALIEHLNYVVYRKATRIPADKFTRERVRQLVQKSEGNLQEIQISRAWKYIRREKENLVVRVTTFDKIEQYVNRGFALIFVGMAALALFVAMTANGIAAMDRLYLSCIAFLFFAGAIFYVWQMIPMNVALKISPVLLRLQQDVTPD